MTLLDLILQSDARARKAHGRVIMTGVSYIGSCLVAEVNNQDTVYAVTSHDFMYIVLICWQRSYLCVFHRLQTKPKLKGRYSQRELAKSM